MRIIVTEEFDYRCDAEGCLGHTSKTPLSAPTEDMIERGLEHRWGSLYWSFPVERAKEEWAKMNGDLVAALWGDETCATEHRNTPASSE